MEYFLFCHQEANFNTYANYIPIKYLSVEEQLKLNRLRIYVENNGDIIVNTKVPVPLGYEVHEPEEITKELTYFEHKTFYDYEFDDKWLEHTVQLTGPGHQRVEFYQKCKHNPKYNVVFSLLNY